jgi:hypothetical protein
MDSDDFYQCEMWEVNAVISAFYELQQRRETEEWERMRMLAFYTVKPHDSKNKIRKPIDLFELPNDKIHSEKNTDLNDWLAAVMEQDRISSERFAQADKDGKIRRGTYN